MTFDKEHRTLLKIGVRTSCAGPEAVEYQRFSFSICRLGSVLYHNGYDRALPTALEENTPSRNFTCLPRIETSSSAVKHTCPITFSAFFPLPSFLPKFFSISWHSNVTIIIFQYDLSLEHAAMSRPASPI